MSSTETEEWKDNQTLLAKTWLQNYLPPSIRDKVDI